MISIRWIASGALIFFSGLSIVANLWITFGGLIKRREKFESLVPFIGGVVGVVGVLLLPVEKAHAFWWVPIVADLGCGFLLLGVIIEHIRKHFFGKRG